MDFTEIIIEISPKDVDKAGDIANMVVPYGIYIEDYSTLEQEVLEIARIDIIDEELLNKDRDKALIHIYIPVDESPAEAIAFLSERYNSEAIPHIISTVTCLESDWINNWKQYFNPMKIGEKLLIRPVWRDDFDPKGRAVLNIDPGLAFGTGTHETTRLCMQALEKIIRPDDIVLDVGTGSGILSVAALLLGAKSAIGVDIDELAVKTANENAKLNNVSDRFTAVSGNLTDKINGKYRVILSNIVADAIISLSENIETFMEPDAVWIVSGIIDTRRNDVLNAVKGKFKIDSEYSENGWICFVFKI
ncbi:MAG: 50S ribosomal protein L11 methyltransferase [Bacillota bacterium]|nr:50S ribosomal protein L11 methyltransferase [Bacillota bacterium]